MDDRKESSVDGSLREVSSTRSYSSSWSKLQVLPNEVAIAISTK